MEPLLKIATIETLYYDRIYALHGLSLEVKEKEIFAVLGPNGAGKTTLLKTIAGLLKDQPKRAPSSSAAGASTGWHRKESPAWGSSTCRKIAVCSGN